MRLNAWKFLTITTCILASCEYANASLPLSFSHVAHVCFSKGSTTLDDSSKITLVRLLYSNFLSHDPQSYSVFIEALGDQTERVASETQANSRAESITKFLLEQSANEKRILPNQVTAYGIYVTKEDHPFATWCPFPTKIRIHGNCLSGKYCELYWRCNPDGCTAGFLP